MATRRQLLALIGVLVGMSSLGVPSAMASQTIMIQASPSPVIDGATTTITATGLSDSGASIYASLDPAGTTCASNPSNDNGTTVISGDAVGAPSYSDTGTATPAQGDYVICAWLMPLADDGSGVPLAVTSTTLTVEPVQAALTVSAPISVAYQQSIPVTVRWRADSAGSLFVDILPSSYGPCTADPANEPQYVGWLTGQAGYTNTDSIGDSAARGTNRYVAGEFAPDTYQLCAWVEEPSGGVVVGPVSLDVRMQALPGSRTYSGHTSQHLPVKVTIAGYTVEDVVYSARFRCNATEYFAGGLRWNGIWNDSVLTAANFGSLKVSNGRFSANLDANPSNRVNLRASLSGGGLVGSLRALMRVGPPQFRTPATCRTGNVRFAIHTGSMSVEHPDRRGRTTHRRRGRTKHR